MDCVHWGVGKCRGLAEAVVVRFGRAERQGSALGRQGKLKRACGGFLMELGQLKSRKGQNFAIIAKLKPCTSLQNKKKN